MSLRYSRLPPTRPPIADSKFPRPAGGIKRVSGGGRNLQFEICKLEFLRTRDRLMH
jgi:hypothetical protein